MTKATAIRNENVITAALTKARKAGKVAATVTDGEGLYLDCNLQPGAARPLVWRFQFKSPVTGKRNRLTFGEYILGNADLGVTIARARERAAEARSLIAQGVDPAQAREAAKQAAAVEQAKAAVVAPVLAKGIKAGTFRALAAEWHAHNLPNWNAKYARTVELSLANHIHPLVGDKLIADIEAIDFVPLRRKHEQAGTVEALVHALRWTSAVFRFAMEDGRAKADPIVIPKALLTTKREQRVHRPAVTSPDSIRALMQAIYARAEENESSVMHAMILAALTMQRIGSIVSMAWADIDLDAQVWVVKAANRKLRTTLKNSRKAQLGQLDHVVPLPTQAVALLRRIKALQSAGALSPSLKRLKASPFVLPNYFDATKHMSRTSATDVLRDDMGYADMHCLHGFRAMGRTAGEYHAGADATHLELQLAHTVKAGETSNLGGAYRRDDFYRSPEQVRMRSASVQQYADWLDEVCGPNPWQGPALKLAA